MTDQEVKPEARITDQEVTPAEESAAVEARRVVATSAPAEEAVASGGETLEEVKSEPATAETIAANAGLTKSEADKDMDNPHRGHEDDETLAQTPPPPTGPPTGIGAATPPPDDSEKDLNGTPTVAEIVAHPGKVWHERAQKWVDAVTGE